MPNATLGNSPHCARSASGKDDVAVPEHRGPATDKRVAELNALLQVTREMMKLITYERDSRALMTGACRLLTRSRGYELACIAMIKAEGGRIVLTGGSQLDWCAVDEVGTANPACVAAQRGKPSTWHESVPEDSFREWQEAPLSRGFKSVAAVPLLHGGRVTGILTLCCQRPSAFHVEELAMLCDLVRDLAFALETLRLEERDSTERKRAQERIQEQAALLEFSHDAISVHGVDGRVQYWNRGAEQLYGWTAEEIVGRPASETIFAQNPFPTAQARNALFESGEWNGEMARPTKDGRELTVLSRWTLVRDEAGRPRSILIVSTDITEKKRLESQLMRAQRLESVGRLASGIAHDLNNVLTPVMMAVQLLQQTRTTEAEQSMLKTLQSCVHRGANIVQQVLLFARGSEGSKVVLQPGHVVREMVQIVKEIFPKSIRVEADCDPEAWAIRADHTQIQQVLMNLFVNARDAMPDGGTLSLQVRNVQLETSQAQIHPKAHAGAYTVFTVADTGCGISPELMDKIFDPFFTTKPVGQGTGLGLPTALGIVESHGGFLSVKSAPGEGTAVSMYIPTTEVSQTQKPPPLLTVQSRGNGELLLVVDDEESVRELLQEVLSAFGYRILIASGGEEALATFRANSANIKFVITDLLMPVMSGQCLIERLHEIDPNVPVLAMSGMSGDLTKVKTQLGNVRAVLPKPFTTPELLDLVDTILRAAA